MPANLEIFMNPIHKKAVVEFHTLVKPLIWRWEEESHWLSLVEKSSTKTEEGFFNWTVL